VYIRDTPNFDVHKGKLLSPAPEFSSSSSEWGLLKFGTQIAEGLTVFEDCLLLLSADGVASSSSDFQAGLLA